MVADAECQTVQTQTCSAAAPAPGCQLVLRQDFNQSGLYCLNVSLANGNSLAVASTRVAVGGGSGARGGWAGGPGGPGGAELPLPAGAAPAAGRTTLLVGLVLIAVALGTAAYTYRSGWAGRGGMLRHGGTAPWHGGSPRPRGWHRGTGGHHDPGAAVALPARSLTPLPCLCPAGA